MNADDFYRIRAFADAGGYKDHAIFGGQPSSVFILPDVDLVRMCRALSDAIDWDRLFSDFINRLLAKLGSFANDWHFGFQYMLCFNIVSCPGLVDEDIDSCDFVRMQNIVQRLLKVKASGRVFQVSSWKEFLALYSVRMTGDFTEAVEHGTHPRMSSADFAAIVRENEERGCCHGKLPSLRYLADRLFDDRGCFKLDDVIALHRGGVYTVPGRRVDLSWLQYAD